MILSMEPGEGEIQANIYWDNQLIGTLSDPTFDPVPLEEAEELASNEGTPKDEY